MTNERFKELLEELDGNSVKTLAEKNARYSADSGDALHNFKEGAEIAGGTPAQACWGYMTKHLVALRDKVERNDFSDKEDFLEKCQDTINYIRFLWCIGNEEEVKEKSDTKEETPDIAVVVRVRHRYITKLMYGYLRDHKPVVLETPDRYIVEWIGVNTGTTYRDEFDKNEYYIEKLK